jgi:cytochrome c553
VRLILAVSLISTTLFVSAAQAGGDPAAGKKKSMSCAACHGANGIAVLPNAGNLAGQPVQYLKKALHDFKTGARKQENMSVVAQALSDQDIEDLAAYYAAFQVTVTPPK